MTSPAAAMMRGRWTPVVFGVAVLAVFTGIVEMLLRTGVLNRFIIPLPSEIVTSFPRLIVSEDILGHFLTTCRECFYAILLVAVIGIPAGAILDRARLLRAATESWIAALASAPLVLLYPLFLIIFGRSQAAIVTMGVIAGLPPVILKTIEGLGGTRRVLVEVGRSFNLSPWQLFAKIQLPAALPTIFVGLRLALIFSLINIVGVEFLINYGGLGQIINDLAERYDLAGTYAAIGFVVLTSILFFSVTEWIEGWLTPRS
jgi:ABC-type nitrate/sulfonate/bicarbonate transport system permease component